MSATKTFLKTPSELLADTWMSTVLNADLIQALCEGRTPIKRNFGHKFFKQGDKLDGCYLVLKGTALLTRRNESGQSHLLALVRPGDLLGSETLYDQKTASATATCLTNVQVLHIPHALFLFMMREERFRSYMMQAKDRLFQEMCRITDRMSRAPLQTKLARFFLNLDEEFGMPDSRGRFVPLRLSRKFLAEAMGCRHETIIRQFTQKGMGDVVETRREGMVIKDVATLYKWAKRKC